MAFARSRHTWLWVVVFLAASGVVVLTARWQRVNHSPVSLPQLANQLESQLHLYPLPAAKSGDPNSGVYLSRQPRPYTSLPQCRRRSFLPEWQDIVLVSAIPTTDEMFTTTLHEWDDAAVILDGFLVFGDPALIADILRVYKSK